MSENKTMRQALIPRLRFPEFLGFDSWENKNIGSFSQVVASGDLDAAYFSQNQTKEHIYPIYSNAIENEGLYGYYSTAKYPKNSITITARGNLGVSFVRKSGFMSIGRLLVVNNFIDTIPYFVNECWNYLVKIPTEVTSIPQLTAIAARAITLPIPTIQEQQKIADCLSCLNDLITAQTQKLCVLKTHKKGLMEKLFPREGKTVPQLRFPEFHNLESWKSVAIGKIISLEYGSPLAEKDRKGGLVPVIGSNGVVGYHNKALLKGPAIIIGRKGSAGKINWITTDCYPIDTTLYVININSKITILSFLFLTLKNSELTKLKDNGAVPGINRNDIYSLITAIPEHVEQQKISDCLFSLENLIAAQTQKLDALKFYKRGLMQQLFPNHW
jgi:type I restriction enzyme S subunit